MSYLVYVIFSFLAALYLSAKTDKKLLSFVFIFWLLAQPVINAKFIIPLPGLPFELQPNRVLFLVMIMYLLGGIFFKRKSITGVQPPFEKYIYIYLVVVLSALLINASYMNFKSVIAVPLEIVTFLAVYTVAKRYMTESVFEAIIKAIILLSIVCAFIAIVQITIEPMLLRTGDIRIAFGTKLRSTGIFQGEYDFGYFQILALIITLIRYEGKAARFFIAPLLVLSVLLTFHRLDYIILFLCYVIYLAFFKRRLSLPMLAIVIAIPAMVFLSYEVYKSMGGHSEVVTERLTQDTVSGRLLQYQIVWNSMWDHPFGVGSYEHPDYVRLMASHNMLQWFKDRLGNPYTMPLTVHNGYLAVGIQYGVLGMLVFTLLVVSMLRYFKNRINPKLQYAAVPFFAVLIYTLSNLSNSVSIFRAYFVLLLAIVCGSLIAFTRQESEKQKHSVSSTLVQAEVKQKTPINSSSFAGRRPG